MKEIAITAGVGLLCVAVWFYPEIEEYNSKQEAWEVAKVLIAEKLNSPSTASFGNQTIEDCFSGYRNRYTFDGWVDAQNGFGAVVRNRVNCEVTNYDGEGWKVSEIEFSPWQSEQ